MSRKTLVLIIDDEPAICWGFRQMLEEEGHEVLIASSAEQGLKLARQHSPALVVLDVRLPGMDGLAALPMLKQIVPRAPVILMTAFGDLQTAVRAIQLGATNYLTKPFGIDRARAVCRAALDSFRRHEATELSAGKGNPDAAIGGNRLVGRSPAMQEVYREIALVAETDLAVLIKGETGTGKKLVAEAIHRNSRRRNHAYIPIAPVAIHPTQIESELFGHLRNAFPGAHEDRQGLLATAEQGTLFVDEIGDLPLSIQTKLLRLLEQKEFVSMGDVHPQPCNVRLLAATSVDLRTMVAKGEFREDLYFRLSGMEILVPPLRDRLEDLELLIQHFLHLYGHPQHAHPVDPAVLDMLRRRTWRGNVRELRHALEHAAVMSRGGGITVEHLPPPRSAPLHLAGQTPSRENDPLTSAVHHWIAEKIQHGSPTDLLNQFLEAVEPTLLEVVLKRTEGNRVEAAEMLGIHRGTLRDRLRRYGMEP